MISFSTLSLDTYKMVLDNAAVVMKAAAEHFGDEADAVLSTKLAPDMLDLTFQLHSLEHHSVNAAKGVLAGGFTTPAAIPERSFAQWIEAIGSWRAELDQISAEAIDAREGETLIFSMGDNKIPFTCENFVMSFSLPNLYFHLTTTYDILRMKGAPLSKRHYLTHMRVGVPS